MIEVFPSGTLHANTRDEVYLRIGDQSRRLSFDERLQLAHDRGEVSWERVLVPECPLDEADTEVLERYRAVLGTSLTTEQLLVARQLATQQDNRIILNRAGVLLMAKNPCLWFPRADLRILRYEGITEETGPRMNLVKDIRLELPLPKLLDEAFRIVGGQLREFTRLSGDGTFETTPEYPSHRALLTYLQEHESVSRTEYEQLVGVSTRTAKSDLRILVSNGFIKKIGSSSAVRYHGV